MLLKSAPVFQNGLRLIQAPAYGGDVCKLSLKFRAPDFYQSRKSAAGRNKESEARGQKSGVRINDQGESQTVNGN